MRLLLSCDQALLTLVFIEQMRSRSNVETDETGTIIDEWCFVGTYSNQGCSLRHSLTAPLAGELPHRKRP